MELTGNVNPLVPGERARLDVYDPTGKSFITNADLYLDKDGTFSSHNESGMFVYDLEIRQVTCSRKLRSVQGNGDLQWRSCRDYFQCD